MLEIARTSDNKLAESILAACDTYFTSLSQEQWKEHIVKKDDTYRVWKLYHPKKYQANFDALKAVLKDFAGSSAGTKQPDKNLVGEWLGICLEVKHSVKGLYTDVSNILKRDAMITKEKLLYFASTIKFCRLIDISRHTGHGRTINKNLIAYPKRYKVT